MRRSKNVFFGFLMTATLFAFPFQSKSVKGKETASAKAECVMELSSGRVLYEKNGETTLPMASTTKILTAITVLEHAGDLQEKFPVPECAVNVEGSSVYLKAGEEVSTEELLYGLMLRSGNDAAVALAVHAFGGLEECSVEMNKTAQKAGALHSCFLTPHGLPKDGHYTTARDLSLITCYALKNPIFAQIVSTKTYQPRGWVNKNKMLYSFDGAIGVKTGYTKEAGRCLVSAVKRENMTLVCTVLNCGDTYGRSKELLSDAFSAYEYAQILSCKTPVVGKIGEKEYTLHVKKDLYYPLLPEERAHVERKVVITASKRPKKDDLVGKIEFYLANRLLFSENLYKL